MRTWREIDDDFCVIVIYNPHDIPMLFKYFIEILFEDFCIFLLFFAYKPDTHTCQNVDLIIYSFKLDFFLLKNLLESLKNLQKSCILYSQNFSFPPKISSNSQNFSAR